MAGATGLDAGAAETTTATCNVLIGRAAVPPEFDGQEIAWGPYLYHTDQIGGDRRLRAAADRIEKAVFHLGARKRGRVDRTVPGQL